VRYWADGRGAVGFRLEGRDDIEYVYLSPTLEAGGAVAVHHGTEPDDEPVIHLSTLHPAH
jgi:hypothetical protein